MTVKTRWRVDWWENGRKKVKRFGSYKAAYEWACSHLDSSILVEQERSR